MSDDRATKPIKSSECDVEEFLGSVTDPRRRDDASEATRLMARTTGATPQMWGASTIGFGVMPYTTADGRRREWFAVGLAPRKAALTLYGLTFYGSNAELLEQLGPHSVGKGCLYLKRLADADLAVLTELIATAWHTNHRRDPSTS